MIVVGIAGYKRCGKDTLCKALTEELANLGLTAKRRALADELKEEIAVTLHWVNPAISAEEHLRRMNCDEWKEKYRLIMQWWGTEWRRDETMAGWDSYWIDKVTEWLNTAGSDIVIVPDIRFPNEAKWCGEHNGVVVWMNRPGSVTSGHASESALNGYKQFDVVIDNDGDYERLQSKALWVVEKIKGLL